MKIKIGHFRIAERGIVGEGAPFFESYLFLFAKPGVEDMYLSAAIQVGEAEMENLLCRGKMFESGGDHDIIEGPIAQQSAPDIAMDESEVGVVAEDAGSLLEFGKIDVDAQDG